MNIVLNKKNGVPIYIQIKKQIMDSIIDGTIKTGYKMPTERELAESLKVSRNTISSAYKELEIEGVLKSFQGRGTFVAEYNKDYKVKDYKDKVMKFLDLAFEEALENGMDSRSFFAFAEQHIREKIDSINKTRAIYVECNVEQSRMFSSQLTIATNMLVVPITINDLRDMNSDTKKVLEDSQVIVATFNHVNEVARLTSNYNKRILGVAINADLGTIVKIARYPKESKFALFCMSEEFMFKIQQALEGAGLGDLNIRYTNSNKEKEINELINDCDIILVSPGRYKEINNYNKDGKDIIQFIYNLDEGSVKALKSKIVELNISN